MKILVFVKQVPDTSEVKIDPKTNNLVREGVPGILNPYDRNAVEMALKLREEAGGTVCIASMGPAQAAEAVEYCLRMGADEGILLSDRKVGGSDTLATGYILSRLAEYIGFDLILCGNEAIDGCTGQVGPILAGNLNLKQFTYVCGAGTGGRGLKVSRKTGRFVHEYDVSLPAVLCVLKDINEPRKPAEKTDKKVRVITAEELGLEESRIGNSGSPTRVVHIQMSDVRAKSYFTVDDSLPWEERIRYIIRGGMEEQPKKKLWRGTPRELAERMASSKEFARFLENVSWMEG